MAQVLDVNDDTGMVEIELSDTERDMLLSVSIRECLENIDPIHVKVSAEELQKLIEHQFTQAVMNFIQDEDLKLVRDMGKVLCVQIDDVIRYFNVSTEIAHKHVLNNLVNYLCQNEQNIPDIFEHSLDLTDDNVKEKWVKSKVSRFEIIDLSNSDSF